MEEVRETRLRNDSIDFIKLLAVFFVLNSHMGICYAHHGFLATGGAIGDALFFFISGFTLFLGGNYRFDNWYKRRLSRIYPSILAAGIIATIAFASEDSFLDVIMAKRYWFVQCIFLYYILLYPIKIYVTRLWLLFGVSFGIVIVVYFLFFDFSEKSLFWGSTDYFRWIFFFLIVLQGAILGKKGHVEFKKWHLLACVVCVVAWYATCYMYEHSKWQIISVIPMFGITYFLYAISNASGLKKILQTKYLKTPVLFVGSLCLESYLIQKFIITDKMNAFFPFNIPVIMLLVILIAYIVRVLGELIRQSFNKDPYDWKGIFLFFK